MGILSEDRRGELARRGDRAGVAHASAEIAQRPQPALADHALGRLRADDQNAADATGLVPDRAVGEGEVGLLDVPVPLHDEQQIVRPGRLPAQHHLGVQRAHHIPDLRPALHAALPQRARMLGPENRHVAVVVKLDGVGTPPDGHGEARLGADADRGSEALRPAIARSERGGGPVLGADVRAHGAAGRQGRRGRGDVSGGPEIVHDRTQEWGGGAVWRDGRGMTARARGQS